MWSCPCARNFPDDLERVAGDPTFYCGPRLVGKNVLLCGTKEGRFPQHCMVGPHWGCMISTYALILGPTLALLIFVTGLEHWIASLAVFVTGSAVLFAFSLTACSDPGIIYRPAGRLPGSVADPPEDPRDDEMSSTVLCGRCDVKRPRGAIHCHDCDVCVAKFDHHCPWTGKCIGERNIMFFYIFLGCLLVHVVLVGALALVPSLAESL
ncbi:unnamed protein product [Ascophyllum nodosum]